MKKLALVVVMMAMMVGIANAACNVNGCRIDFVNSVVGGDTLIIYEDPVDLLDKIMTTRDVSAVMTANTAMAARETFEDVLALVWAFTDMRSDTGTCATVNFGNSGPLSIISSEF